MSIHELVAAFVAHHVVADDPTPELSRLDRMDGAN
jgi:hypothetical protein